MITKNINSPSGKKYEEITVPGIVYDDEPIEGSFNGITSDAVVKAIDEAKEDMQGKIDEVTLDPSAVAFGNVHLLDEVTEFPADGCILIDSETNGPGEMSKDTLLELTAQNALTGNVAPAFDTTRDEAHKYLAGEKVAYKGKTYTFKVDHYGAWNAADVYERSVESLVSKSYIGLDLAKLNKVVGKNLFNKDTLYKKAGFYVAYNDGSFHTLIGYSVYIVPVKGGETVSFNQSNNVCALSVIPNLNEYENYQKVIGYISGVSTNAQGWSVPANAVCLLVSVQDSNASTCQIEKGSSSTSYESYKEGVDKDNVFGLAAKFAEVESTFDLKLTDKLDKDRSKNLFNKDTSNKKANVYVNYNTGYMSSMSGWSAYVVEIPNGVTQVSINQSGAHCCAFSDIPDLTTASGTIPNYLGGVTGASNQGWTLPAGTRSIIVSCQDTLASSTQVESGASSTSYAPYGVGLDWSKILNKPTQERSRILFVGTGLTYTTIQSAVTDAYDGDTIVVMPGTYTESVSNKTKFLNIIGISRDSCILTYPALNYANPPLDIAKGCVSNLTIKTTGQPASGDAGAYGAHIDWDTQIDSSLQFRNCKFYSESRPCVGIGLRSNYTLSFIDCSFENSSGQVPFYAHEQQSNNITGQRLEIVNCSFSNKGNNATDAAIMLQETGSLSGNNADLLMQRCIMKRTYGAFTDSNKAVILHIYGGGEPSGNKYLGSSTWSLDFMSELNNESIANSSEQ